MKPLTSLLIRLLFLYEVSSSLFYSISPIDCDCHFLFSIRSESCIVESVSIEESEWGTVTVGSDSSIGDHRQFDSMVPDLL